MHTFFEDENWLVVNKPTGLSTHGATPGDLGLCEWLKLHQSRQTYVVSRLDKDTSGLLLLAKNRESSKRAELIHKGSTSQKTYLLIVSCESTPSAHWTQRTPLEGSAAETQFRLLKELGGNRFLLEAKISSGKKHQIRRHAAFSGCPILGDGLYGGKNFSRLCLHCHSISWPDIAASLTSPLPPSLESLAQKQPPSTAAELVSADRRLGCLDSITNSYRLLHRGEGNGDFSIDKFQNHACAWLYEKKDFELCEQALETLSPLYNLECGVIKILHRDPHHKGELCETRILGKTPPERIWVKEHDLSFPVNILAQEQTGFFLDQRDNRRRAALTAPGARMANLFSYTCSFSLAAMTSNPPPEVVFSVDISKSALREGMATLEGSQLQQLQVGKFIQEDARKWLERQLRKKNSVPFELVICDPPTFGKSRGKPAFRLEKEWTELARQISSLLHPQGKALFCTNNRKLSSNWLQARLSEFFSHVERVRTPLDFPEDIDPVHNRMFWCSHRPMPINEGTASIASV